MSDNVRLMPKTDPNVILEKAKDWDLKTVVVIGWDSDKVFRIGGSDTALSEISWLLRNAEDWLSEAMATGK